MNRMHHIFLLAALFFMPSCIREMEDDCGNRLKVCFSATFDSRASALLRPQDLKYLDLFVFDDNSLYVGTWRDDHVRFSPGYHMTVPLEAGTYTLVAWCNARSSYYYKTTFIKGRTTLSEATIALAHSDGGVDTPPGLLLFGHYLRARVTGARDQSLVVPLQRVTYDIHITTEGLPASDDDFRLTITDIVSEGKFDSRVSPSSQEIRYTAACDKTAGGRLFAPLTVVKLEEQRVTPVVSLANKTAGTELFKGNLVRMILALRELNPPVEVDFDKIYTYDIVLKFDVDMNVTISINGWNVPGGGSLDLE